MLWAWSQIAHLRKRRLLSGRRLYDQCTLLAFTAEKQEWKKTKKIRHRGTHEALGRVCQSVRRETECRAYHSFCFALLIHFADVSCPSRETRGTLYLSRMPLISSG